MIAGLDSGDALANGFDDAGTFVTKDDGEGSFGILSAKGVGVW
jgi:hypothetical protein